jgi:hypothetical protein
MLAQDFLFLLLRSRDDPLKELWDVRRHDS